MNRPTARIVPEAPARFSVEEYMAMAGGALGEIVGKIELVEGVIVRMAPANYPHFSVQRQLFRKLDTIFGEGIDGWIVGQELTVRLGTATVRHPDIAIFRDPGAITGIVGRDALLLAAEIAGSPLRDDLGPKRLSCAQAQVPNYWVVDVQGRVIHRFTGPRDGDYSTETVSPFGEPLPVPGTDRTITID